MKKRYIMISILFGTIILGIGFIIGQRNPIHQNTHLSNLQKSSNNSIIESIKTDSSSSSKGDKSTRETSVNNRKLPKELISYSDEEIEYARVWLAVMGEDYLERNGNENFNLNVSFIKRGEPINSAKEYLNINWPKDIIVLTGNASVQGQIFYSSNFDGTVSVYPMPSHWHQTEQEFEDDDYMSKFLNNILTNKQIVTVPAGNPLLVKELILLENIIK